MKKTIPPMEIPEAIEDVLYIYECERCDKSGREYTASEIIRNRMEKAGIKAMHHVTFSGNINLYSVV